MTGSLRARLNELAARGQPLNFKQAVGVVVPIAVEAAELHRGGHLLFLHPSCLVEDEYGYYHLDHGRAKFAPTEPRDVACLAPELQGSQPGNARASVYAIGAILYELVTGATVGRGMKRPSEVVGGLPQDFELVLSKALVAHPQRRPDDLNALAQALYNLAPTASIAPPPADTSHLDQDEGFEVDVSLSMLPPAPQQAPAAGPRPAAGAPAQAVAAPAQAAAAPAQARVQAVPAQQAPAGHRPAGAVSGNMADQTQQLAQLKARLEADRTPRYVVIKDGMDHGPFAGVELLQQIANHTFEPDDVVRDSVTSTELAIEDHPDFSHFARHAKIHRDIKEEKAAIERVVVQEGRSTRSKAVFGMIIVGALLVAGGVWFLTQRGSRSDEIAVQGETASNVDSDAGLDVKKGRKWGGKRGGVVGSRGGYPMLGGGMSCEGARAKYVESMNIGGPRGQADITAGQYGAVLNRGSYFAGCGVPDSMKLNICAAVQNGRAVGVTVVTTPRNGRIASCVASGVRRLHFPSNPKLDVTRTVF